MSGATYLIKSKEYLRELTDDIEQLFAKAKTMLPKEDGVSHEEDSGRKKVKTNDETVSTEAKKLLEHPATAIGDSRDKKIDRPEEKVNWTDFRNQKAHQRRRHGKTGPSAKKVKCNEEIPVTAKATMDSNREYSDTARSADTKPIPSSKTEAHSQTSPV